MSVLFQKWRDIYRNFRFFYIHNWWSLNRDRVEIGKPMLFRQKTVITGFGRAVLGSGSSFGYKLGGFHEIGVIEIQPRYRDSRIVIGREVSTNNNLFFCAANYIEIGDGTLIGQNVTIMDHEAHGVDPGKRRQIGEIGKVLIGKNVWVGNNVLILKNTVIGENSVVAAGAVVSGEFPPNVVLGGVPAKVIKKIEV